MRIAILLTALVVSACATTSDTREPDAFDDFVVVSELPTVDRIATDTRDRWTVLTDRYLIYRTRRNAYLFEMRGRCPALLNAVFDGRFMDPDVRRDRFLRPRVDTMRGCPIGEIYEITEAQVVELENMGTAPGPRR